MPKNNIFVPFNYPPKSPLSEISEDESLTSPYLDNPRFEYTHDTTYPSPDKDDNIFPNASHIYKQIKQQVDASCQQQRHDDIGSQVSSLDICNFGGYADYTIPSSIQSSEAQKPKDSRGSHRRTLSEMISSYAPLTPEAPSMPFVLEDNEEYDALYTHQEPPEPEPIIKDEFLGPNPYLERNDLYTFGSNVAKDIYPDIDSSSPTRLFSPDPIGSLQAPTTSSPCIGNFFSMEGMMNSPEISDPEGNYLSDIASPVIKSEDHFEPSSTVALIGDTPDMKPNFSKGKSHEPFAPTWQPVVVATPDKGLRKIQDRSTSPNRKSTGSKSLIESFIGRPTAQNSKYVCLYMGCGKQLSRRYNVYSHIQTHLCDRPYKCETCPARFVRMHDLQRHQKIHNDKKPFVCPCGKAFIRHDALTRHRMREICIGGIHVPGKEKRPKMRKGRPKKRAEKHAENPEAGSPSSSIDPAGGMSSSIESQSGIEDFQSEMEEALIASHHYDNNASFPVGLGISDGSHSIKQHDFETVFANTLMSEMNRS